MQQEGKRRKGKKGHVSAESAPLEEPSLKFHMVFPLTYNQPEHSHVAVSIITFLSSPGH